MITLTEKPSSASDLLEAAYRELEFDQGALVSTIRTPDGIVSGDWIDRGDWQLLANQVGAESIFFVDRDPVVVFAKLEDAAPDVARKLYERIWCMARPQILFLAAPGKLSAFDLTKAPPKPSESIEDRGRLIAVASSIAEVQSKLGAYHRERLETGVTFGDERFRNAANRSDHALIRDLRIVRQQLTEVDVGRKRPTLRHLHSLIGRAIFLRYLEDRGILLPAYFEKVAAGRREWMKLIAQVPSGIPLESRFAELRFLRVLQNKEFTYALFEQISRDFNGDTFPIDGDERDRIHQAHLEKLRGFLTGNTSEQQNLFFFAYRFDVIPIELISTIYEEFYNERAGKDKNQGSHYTPPTLVEFVLAQTLTPDVLAKKPRVIDPACGSGIFLVESFRRIVRHLYVEQKGRRVSRPQLRKILRDQISGIDLNEEAVRVAAFSLYLAFLHYQEPREINSERRLPYLKWVPRDEQLKKTKAVPEAQFFDILLHANAFDVVSENCSPEIVQRFGPSSVSIVVGNPPWGNPRKNDAVAQGAMVVTKSWCKPGSGRPLGDKELSQAFIYLTNALLKEGGRAGLLVSSGVLFKHHKNSQEFRRVWLTSTRLEKIVNFAHVRHVFFSGSQREAKGISPFISVIFEKVAEVPLDTQFEYWSAKRTVVVENMRSVVLNRGDMRWLSQRDCLQYEKLWKIHWWGGYRDEALIRLIEGFPTLKNLPKHLDNIKVNFGQGFKEANKAVPASWLENYRELPPHEFSSYGAVAVARLTKVPRRVERRGVEEVYSGRRLLVARGIRAGGQITSRFETKKYCFRNSIHGVRFTGLEKWQEAVITAVFWSSIARYYYFVTSGSWGFWHDELHLENIAEMPIAFPADEVLRNRIIRVVDELKGLDLNPQGLELGGSAARQRLPALERELDAVVFDLYKLNAAERDLVREMCDVGLDLFYQNQKSAAVGPVVLPDQQVGTFADVSNAKDGLSHYLRIFLEKWKKEFGQNGELVWRVLSPPSRAPLLAISFSVNESKARVANDDSVEAWRAVLSKLEQSSRTPVGGSRIFIDTFFRHVSDHQILFVKRNERRFWTPTAAREDVESTLTYLMNRGHASLGRDK